ncbi:MAG: extracellular solute-binding protein [Lachnospiraceae bacterium]|nr:extracellular solute-binding protein [Lachnospiraceae bacterium]
MKKRIKSLVALALISVMIAGCGKQEADQEVKQESEVQSEVKNASTQQAEISQYPEYLNLEGYRPIVKEGEKITLKVAVGRDDCAETPVEDTWFYHFVEEKLNIDLEVEWVTDSERKNLMLAADDLPDIMIGIGISTEDLIKYGVENEQFLALSDYVSEELTPNYLALCEQYKDYMDFYTAPDGKIYTIPTISSVGRIGYGDSLSVYRMYVDTKYMEAAGIDELPDTLDGFVDMLRKFKALDPTEMGVDEIWPLASCWKYDLAYYQNAFGWITSEWNDLTVPCWDMEKGEVVVPCMEEKYADYVTLLNTLYSEGLIHPDYLTMDTQASRALESAGKVAVCCDSAPYVFNQERFAEYVSAIPLTSEWSKEAVATAGSVCRSPAFFVSASTEYPELCMRLVDYLCTDEGMVYWSTGCLEGSEDTLGIITGFRLNESGTDAEYEEIVSGKYANLLAYRSNVLAISQPSYICQNEVNLILQEMCGVENPQYPELDITNPDAHYRSIVAAAAEGHLVQGLPTMYIGQDIQVEYTDLKTVLKNYVETETAKFVVGQRPLSELPDFQEELKAMGGERYESIVKDAYAGYAGPVK